jgi:hypothetical protein
MPQTSFPCHDHTRWEILTFPYLQSKSSRFVSFCHATNARDAMCNATSQRASLPHIRPYLACTLHKTCSPVHSIPTEPFPARSSTQCCTVLRASETVDIGDSIGRDSYPISWNSPPSHRLPGFAGPFGGSQAQSIQTSDPPSFPSGHEAQLVECFFPCCVPSTDIPFLRSQRINEAAG